MYPSASTPGRTTESAVYGYLNRPEIVEFRGQYFYGPNPVPSSSSLHATAASSEQPFIAPPAITGSKSTQRTGNSINHLKLFPHPMNDHLLL